MQDDIDYYYYKIDSLRRTFTLKDASDSLHVFTYTNPAKAQLLLTGKWKGQGVQILMKDVPIDSMWLNRDRIRLIRD